MGSRESGACDRTARGRSGSIFAVAMAWITNESSYKRQCDRGKMFHVSVTQACTQIVLQNNQGPPVAYISRCTFTLQDEHPKNISESLTESSDDWLGSYR